MLLSYFNLASCTLARNSLNVCKTKKNCQQIIETVTSIIQMFSLFSRKFSIRTTGKKDNIFIGMSPSVNGQLEVNMTQLGHKQHRHLPCRPKFSGVLEYSCLVFLSNVVTQQHHTTILRNTRQHYSRTSCYISQEHPEILPTNKSKQFCFYNHCCNAEHFTRLP